MKANDNRKAHPFEDRKAWLIAMASNLEPGADGHAGRRAMIRELENIEPGISDHMHARRRPKPCASRRWVCEADLCPTCPP